MFTCYPCLEQLHTGCSRGPCMCACRDKNPDGPHQGRDHGTPRAVVATISVARPTNSPGATYTNRPVVPAGPAAPGGEGIT